MDCEQIRYYLFVMASTLGGLVARYMEVISLSLSRDPERDYPRDYSQHFQTTHLLAADDVTDVLRHHRVMLNQSDTFT